MPAWWFLIYKIPSEPSRLRAAIWREVHRLGAVYLQDGVCLVPDVLDMELGIDALRERVVAMGGKAWAFRANSAVTGQDSELENLFRAAQADELRELRSTADTLCRQLEDAKSHFDMGEEGFARCESELRRLRSSLRTLRAHQFFKEPVFDEIETLLDRSHNLLVEGGETDEVGYQG